MEFKKSEASRLSRRQLLWMLGAGTTGGLMLGTRPSVRNAFASSEPPESSMPESSLPDTAFAAVGGPTVADLAATLEYDVAKIFRHVTDEVAYEPYAGALRGATGAMWGQAANSVDKALLLAALLTEAQVPYRFAIGELDDDLAAALATSTVTDVTAARQRAASVLLRPEVAEGWTGEGPWERNPDIDPLLAAARVQFDAGVLLIEEALAAAGIVLPEPANTLPEAERSEHVWVQYADGPTWIDLDPSIPDAQPAMSYAIAAQTVDALDPAMFHSVEIRVVAEVVTGGVPTRTTVLTHEVRCADVQGVPIFIAHGPADWLGVGAAITGEQQYVPMLVVGEELAEGSIVTLTSGDGVADVFDDESGGAEGQTLAEWIEIDVRLPGGEVRNAARNVFDRVSPADRDSGTIDLTALAPIEVTHIDDEIGDIFLPFSGPIVLSVAGQPLPWSAYDVDVVADDDTGVIVACAQAFHFIRDICGLELLPTIGHQVYADEPTVLAMFLSPTAILEEGTQNITFGVDILSAHHGASVIQDSASSTRAGIAAGVLDHVAERLLVEGLFSLPEAPPLVAVSVGLVFEQAAADGVPVVTLQPEAREAMPDVPPSVQALITAALDHGRVVVVPARSVTVAGEDHIGWWELDPESGHTIDRLDNGRSVSMGEAGLLLLKVIKATACYRAVGSAVLFVVRSAMGSIDTAGGLAFSYGMMTASAIGCAFA